MPPTFSVVTTCKGRLDHLKITLPRLMAMPDCEVVVVDYDCPDGAADWVRANHPTAVVVQVRDRPFFSVAKARNLGVAASSAAWLILLDADVLVAPGLVEALKPAIEPGAMLQPYPRTHQLWGALVVGRADFDAVGGYDEIYEGWGSEDVDLTMRLLEAGARGGTFAGDLMTSLPHDHHLRGQFHEIGDIRINGAINALYWMVKRDLLRQEVQITPQMANNLYAGARDALQKQDGPKRLDVRLPAQELSGRTLHVTISYQLSEFGIIPGG